MWVKVLKRNLALISIFFIIIFVALASCSPRSGEETSAETGVDFSDSSLCYTCHLPASQSMEDPSMLGYTHSAFDCLFCHSDSEGLEAKHEGVTEPPATMKFSQIGSKEFCFTCHGDYATLTKKTSDYFIDGQQINPHAPHATDSSVEELNCNNCHMIHSMTRGVPESCYGCHHEKSFEKCSVCHAQ